MSKSKDLEYYPSTGNPYSFATSVFAFLGFAFAFGIIAGALEVLYLSHLFVKRSLVAKIVLKSIISIVAIVLFLLVVSTIGNAMVLRIGITNMQVLSNTWS